ncbi:efflux RND transporter periplasmic adaptor subunit [Lichenicoccus sp.]|uniref:efflux RND transporter periplasmic adaptor subunit n=1 Tax=Lichenicoccus sp. TaxID=2781899 RepID=UPI003D10619A
MLSVIRTATAVLAACAVAWALPAPAAAQAGGGGPPTVGVATVHSAPVTSTSQFFGRVQAIDSVALIARVTGYLDKRLFNGGEDVKQGQLLYVLEQGPFQAQVLSQQGNLAQAKANVRNASLSLKRQQALLHTPAGQQSNLDNAVATQGSNAGAVLTAEGNLQAAQINLGYTEIRAPIDGRISATSVNPGNVVGPTSGTLATVVSQDPMYVIFPVASREVDSMQKKFAAVGGLAAAKIKLRLTGGTIYDKTGTLDYVAPTVSTNTDTITLRATVPNPERDGGDKGGVSSRELVDGAFVTVLISDPHPVVSILIPRGAVLSDQQGDYVFVVDANNKAQRANVKLGQTIKAEQVVLSGLKDGQRIIVDGLQSVHTGAAVKPAAPETGVGDPDAAGGE